MTHIRYLNVLWKSCWFTSQLSRIFTLARRQASGGKFCVVWKFRLLTKNYCKLSGNSPSAIVLCSTLQFSRAASQSSSETVWHFAVICDCCDDSSSFPHNIGNFTTDDEEALKIDYLLLSLGLSLSLICAQEWITSSRRILWYSWHRRCDLTINLDRFQFWFWNQLSGLFSLYKLYNLKVRTLAVNLRSFKSPQFWKFQDR